MLSPMEFFRRGADLLTPSHFSSIEQWKIHFAMSIGIHFLVFLMAIIAPLIFQYRPSLPEVYTVNLFSATDIKTPPVVQPKKAPVVPRKVKKNISVKKPAPTPVVKPAPPKAVSLKPIKTKSKKDLDKIKELQERLLAEKNAKEAEKAAERNIKDALNKLRQSLQTEAVTEEQTEAAETSPAASGAGVVVDEVTKSYLIAVNNQIQEYWVLPDLQNWKDTLEAIIVIRVRRDGVVIDKKFEKKSENTYFNQFVEKTIQDASPLPTFPPGLNEKEMEIGLRFRPGELF